MFLKIYAKYIYGLFTLFYIHLTIFVSLYNNVSLIIPLIY